jgi:hypothetical protein
MGTPFGTDGRLSEISDLTESLTSSLILIFAESYEEGKLSMGNNLTDEFSKREVYYKLTDSEFENQFLTLKYKITEMGYPFEILFESIRIDSPTELKIQVDDSLVNQLPKKMIKELTDYFYSL